MDLTVTDAASERYDAMNSNYIRILLVGLIVTAIVVGSFRRRTVLATPKAEDDFQIVKVADGVYAAIAKSGGLASGNAGFVIGKDGVLIFDTFFTPAAIEELIGEIQSLTKLPVKFAVN